MAPAQAPQRPRRGAPLRSEHFTLGLPPNARSEPGISQGIELLMAIPKRQLKRAVDRNTVRRIAREAWRAAMTPEAVRPAAGEQERGSALLRLVTRPQGFAGLAHGARKRLWRSELDGLFAGAAAPRTR